MRGLEAPTLVWDLAPTRVYAPDLLDTVHWRRRPSPPMRRLGEYELIKKIGAGGMGQVWMGQRTVLGGTKQVVAIKLLGDQHGNIERQRELFIREARISLSLNHSNIVRVSDAGEADGQAYMVMEWVDGLTVGQLLGALSREQTALSLRVVTYVIGEVLRALAYAQTIHLEEGSQGIIHRDISPQNVLVSVSGEVKLVDFGVARVVAEETSGELRGKLGYLAPEQLRGGKLDARVDLYAVGVLLHEMADGVRFRQARDPTHMYGLVMSGEIAPLSRTQLPKELDELRVGLLEPDPARRISSAEGAFEMLSAWSGYGDASLELARLVRVHAGVDAPRSGVHAAAAASGSLPAASAPGDETRTRTSRPDAPQELVSRDSGPRAAETRTQVAVSAPEDASEQKRMGRSAALWLSGLGALVVMGWGIATFAVEPAVEPLTNAAPSSPASGDPGGSDTVAREAVGASEPAEAAPSGLPAAQEMAETPASTEVVSKPPSQSVREPTEALLAPPEASSESSRGGRAVLGAAPASAEPDEALGATGPSGASGVQRDGGSSDREPQPPKAVRPATLTLHAGTLNWAYVKIAGRRHLIEPRKKGIRVKPGKHTVYVSTEADGGGPYRRAGRIDLDAGARYELRFEKSPLGLVLSRKR